MQKKVHKLKDFYPDAYQLIAIASHQSDYRLSWALNQQFNWHLTQTGDLVVKPPKDGKDQHFSRFSYSDPQDNAYHLIANKSQDGFCIPSMTNIDFLLKITGNFTKADLQPVIEKIRNIDFVITAFILENLKEKDKKKFIF
ncbi:MAG: IPExxxVDY family protein [Bacteroidales bacterium]|nr:IPExxxVDY family protein [Bacteroidales bacterium]